VGIEATGPIHWFTSVCCGARPPKLRIGDSAKIRASEVPRQKEKKTDERDARLISIACWRSAFRKIGVPTPSGTGPPACGCWHRHSWVLRKMLTNKRHCSHEPGLCARQKCSPRRACAELGSLTLGPWAAAGARGTLKMLANRSSHSGVDREEFWKKPKAREDAAPL